MANRSPFSPLTSSRFHGFFIEASRRPRTRSRIGLLLSWGTILVAVLATVSGCGESEPSPPSEAVSPTETPSVVAVPSEPSPSATPATGEVAVNNTLITAEGIGAARLGQTLGDLKEILGDQVELTTEPSFIVDFDAISVRRGDEVLYSILYLAGESFGDEDVIQGLFTDNPRFRTAEGVGPGTPIADAETAYGDTTLSYNTQNESREYARFAQQPARNLSFATGNGAANPAGIYSSATADYNETTDFRPDATIQSVLVVCLMETCAPTPEEGGGT